MKQLTPEDLAQFRMRRAAVEQAGYAFAMIQVGYSEWSKGIRQRYKLRGEFDVDWERGIIQMRDKPNGGRNEKRQTVRRKKQAAQASTSTARNSRARGLRRKK